MPWGEGPHYEHIGLYAYRRAALDRFVTLPRGVLEQRERLEQLRALEAGMRISVSLIDPAPARGPGRHPGRSRTRPPASGGFLGRRIPGQVSDDPALSQLRDLSSRKPEPAAVDLGVVLADRRARPRPAPGRGRAAAAARSAR